MPKGRPQKKKIIHEQPRIDRFSPKGRPEFPDEIELSIEEYESIRLADFVRLQQKQSAEMMGISQQSFSRIIRAARCKMADAIVNAKIMHIKGGNFVNKRCLDITNKLKRRKNG
ncbi:MAG: DUF134 domain-containing protein [Candidatus Omnitrophota bacterium]|nr:DUF134 domain-containing protein [Candidatus Omnitrophota bacterium]